jgi:hypothetical protein
MEARCVAAATSQWPAASPNPEGRSQKLGPQLDP